MKYKKNYDGDNDGRANELRLDESCYHGRVNVKTEGKCLESIFYQVKESLLIFWELKIFTG